VFPKGALRASRILDSCTNSILAKNCHGTINGIVAVVLDNIVLDLEGPIKTKAEVLFLRLKTKTDVIGN
jgi:hypothetical protein